jgi:two-component system, cell cycle response regulator DivK
MGANQKYIERMDETIPKKLVLVVDDDLPSYQLIEELFSELNVRLKHFISGHNLIEWFREGGLPDLVIMDVQLPGISGLELTRQIKEIVPSMPVIAYTSFAMPGDKERCIKSGCDDYISKPIDLDRFVETASKYLF